MIDRAEIEFTLAMAQKGVRCEAPAKVMEELCRVYLCWLDAPIVPVTAGDDPEDLSRCGEILAVLDETLIGKRVKLLEVE